ncbi:MAG: hypothetical protein WCV63_00595 [Negativicutes bacterium]
MFEQIIDKDTLLAIIIRADYQGGKVEFFTPYDFSQQLAYMKRPSGEVIPRHVHNIVERKVQYTQEVLLIRRGVLRVDFYNDARVFFRSCELVAGDVLMLCSGGHGFEVIEEVEMIEIKQGPYCGDADKVRF